VLAPDDDVELPAGEPGRLAVDIDASPLFWFAGYDGDATRSAEKFTADGRWYLTGDTAAIAANGTHHFVGRDDDVIVMAGYRIGPGDVEGVLMSHPAVAEAAVVAAPDELRGEVLEAFVVPASESAGSDDLTRELQQLVKTDFAAHAFPRRVHYVDALPKTPSGKIQRFVLRQQLRSEGETA
jgi:acetyl-CoA synthetase